MCESSLTLGKNDVLEIFGLVWVFSSQPQLKSSHQHGQFLCCVKPLCQEVSGTKSTHNLLTASERGGQHF